MGKNNNNAKLDKQLGKLTPKEEAMIYGTVLGDAHIQKKSENTFRLKVEHSEKQREYVDWKYQQLKRLCSTTQPPKQVKSNKVYWNYVFYTGSTSLLKEIYELFYKPVTDPKTGKVRYVKTITQELIDKIPMDPLVLATFFLDDGSVRNDCYAGRLATQGFSQEGCLLIAGYLAKWGINCDVVFHLVEKNQYTVSIPAASFGKLVSIIEPIVKEIPTMVYKLWLATPTTPSSKAGWQMNNADPVTTEENFR